LFTREYEENTYGPVGEQPCVVVPIEVRANLKNNQTEQRKVQNS
jgi:hypothetical protein